MATLTYNKEFKNVSSYHPAIAEWMHMVESGEFIACQEQFLLMELVKEKLSKENVFVDSQKLDNALSTAEKYFFKLHPFQKFIYAAVFGMFQYDEDGDVQLVFNEYFIYAGRGFGKNALMSLMAFELTTKNHGVENYRVDIVATSEEQAMTSFKDVHNMLEARKKDFKAKYKWNLEVIEHKKNKSSIKYRTSAPKTKDGGRPGAVAFDEIHAYENFKSFNVHTTGMGKIEFSRKFYLTTDGDVRGQVLDVIKKRALAVLKSKGKNSKGEESRMFPFICRLDEDDEVNNPEFWPKANPILPYNKELRTTLMEEYDMALDVPSLMFTFMTKRMNRPTEDKLSMVASWDLIEAGKEHEMIDIKGMQCIGGVDFSTSLDFTAVGLLFKKGEKKYWLHHSFVTKWSMKTTNYDFPIEEAVAAGLCTIINGNIIDEKDVADWFMTQVKNNGVKIVDILGDRFRINALKEEFGKQGLPIHEVPSGPITHAKLAPTIDILFAKKRIAYPNDFMMSWYINNVLVTTDKKGNRSYGKIEPIKRKTDGWMALVHALSKIDEIKVQPKYNNKLKTRTY